MRGAATPVYAGKIGTVKSAKIFNATVANKFFINPRQFNSINAHKNIGIFIIKQNMPLGKPVRSPTNWPIPITPPGEILFGSVKQFIDIA